MKSPRRLLRLSLIVAATSLAACNSGDTVLIALNADQHVSKYDLYVRDAKTGAQLLHTDWTTLPRDITQSAFKIGLTLQRTGQFVLVIVGADGPTEGPRPAPGSPQFYWAKTVTVEGNAEIDAQLLHVPAGDDQDRDLYPDGVDWPKHVPAAAALELSLLDCDDKMDFPQRKLTAADVHPFATEICGDGIDENCDGDGDEACVDSDGDGDPDPTDCAPKDPKIHHPITDPTSPHYDPFPESPNCCGYSLGKSGADATKDLSGDKSCHAKTCDDGVDQDCDGVDMKCKADQDCDEYAASNKMQMGCSAPANNPPGNDCNDCDPKISPGAPEICGDGIDNNCNGLIDENCVPCDLDGDGFQRKDAKNGCPDAMYVASGKKTDCNDEDAGVFPGSTSASFPVRVPRLVQTGQATCGDKEGGSVACALRGTCRNKNVDGSPEDADCDGSAYEGCPAPVGNVVCDADGDGFIDGTKAATCDPMNKLPHDCNDGDPHIFPGAPEICGDGIAQNCLQDSPCGTDADGDKYDSSVDCDDNNPSVHPWAVELCDGVDNDCDGLVDEGNPDGTGKPMVSGNQVLHCSDSGVGECKPAVGDCVCSANSLKAMNFDQATRKACPGETAEIDTGAMNSASAPRCYGAPQPQPQSCNPANPKDDDCDGRVDAPDGKNFPMVGQSCWPGALGLCAPGKGGTVTGCKMAAQGQSSNCFRPSDVNPWLLCDAQPSMCPAAEKCNGFDDNCDGVLPVEERDLDGDGYLACGSSDVKYGNGMACEAQLAQLLKGCGDCADAAGTTGGVPNQLIHPGAADVCDGVDNDCATATPDGTADCPGPKPAKICCGGNGCKDPTNDVANCNGCGNLCVEANAIAQCSASACAVQSCNNGFADCNTLPVDGCEINVTNDASHCGGCANSCSSNNMATRTCGSSACNGSCVVGFADCNNNKLTDGCEINTTNDADHCGACANVCSASNMATRTCGGSLCNGICNVGFADCNNNKLTDGCEINTTSDAAHCGSCANVCSANHISAPTCAGSTCNGSCDAGFADCNNNKLTDGCEINTTNDANHCGGCANICSSNNMASRTCGGSLCNGACNVGFADCNSNKLADGCEINLNTDAAHCGGCANLCSSNNIASPTCGAGVCNGACNAGFADCNNNKLVDGCEINTTNDAAHCGGCANVCSSQNIASPTCGAGLCNGACNAGFADCDNNKLVNGCETGILVDANNCSACGVVCSSNHMATRTCGAGVCNGSCAAGFADCNSNKQTDGCEINTTNDKNNCGACAAVCSSNNITTPTCGTSLCNGTCNAGFADCNNDKLVDGCEVNTTTDANNCGGCAKSCSANHITTPTCGASLCNGSCDAGYADCNNNKLADGCEVSTNSDANNCGACAAVCSSANMATRTCGAGLCNGTCTAGFADCNNNKLTDGCEVSTNSDANNCGACAAVCSSANMATRTCGAGLCNGTCTAGFADCNNNKLTDGCEVATNTDANNCGACAAVCSSANMATRTCGAGLCNGTCTAGFADCNNNKLTDGCEVATNTDANNCGACAAVCSSANMATRTCGAGLCNGTCTAGFADCNNNKLTDGCEVATNTDANNCGACAAVCSSANMATRTCGAGLCNGTCTAGFADCNNNKLTDGCEVNTNTDANNCGACAAVCSSAHMATRTCGAGLCNGTCTAGFADCNNNKLTDGCEASLSADTTCGSCGNNCTAGTSNKVCIGGASCGCNMNTDCGGATPACDTVNHVCVACVDNTTCSGATPVCKTATHTCVECVAAGDCSANNKGHVCSGSNVCTCVANTDCPGGIAPYCDTGTSPATCGCGTGGTVCGANLLCTTASAGGACRTSPGNACAMPSDCASTGGCSTTCAKMATGQPCSGNADCASNSCTAGLCT